MHERSVEVKMERCHDGIGVSDVVSVCQCLSCSCCIVLNSVVHTACQVWQYSSPANPFDALWLVCFMKASLVALKPLSFLESHSCSLCLE